MELNPLGNWKKETRLVGGLLPFQRGEFEFPTRECPLRVISEHLGMSELMSPLPLKAEIS